MIEIQTPGTRPRRLTALAAATAALLLSACSQMPVYERLTAPVAAQWPASAGATDAATDTAPASQAAADVAWQSYFADPGLQQLIELALAHNRDLRVAALNIEQARAQLGIRRADQWPTVNATV
ncbi:MAG TPA: TolC family protein, partial [Burkholderiaceae bacterium]|nr:TolC family protein [Burkholderiaceae bacterium]